MNIGLRVAQPVDDGILTGHEFGKVERTLPRFEATLVEIGLEIALFQASNQLRVIVIRAVFRHQLRADVEDLPARNDNGSTIDCEPIK